MRDDDRVTHGRRVVELTALREARSEESQGIEMSRNVAGAERVQAGPGRALRS
jgi:hypothetical protein